MFLLPFSFSCLDSSLTHTILPQDGHSTSPSGGVKSIAWQLGHLRSRYISFSRMSCMVSLVASSAWDSTRLRMYCAEVI